MALDLLILNHRFIRTPEFFFSAEKKNEAGIEASGQIQEQANLSPKNILIGGMSKRDAMVTTATAASNTIIIPGLLKQNAKALKNLISSKLIS